MIYWSDLIAGNWINISSGNGLVSSDNKPLHESMLTQILIWRH